MNRHFACSDLHGIWQLWEQIDAYCDETDTIFFLGDAADRGPDGLRLMKTLLIDKRVKYIKGNHEDMLVNAFYESDFSLVRYNGGNPTIKDFQKLSEENKEWLINKLDKLPKELDYTNTNGIHIIMNHSGYDATNPLIEWRGEDPYIWDRRQICCPWHGDDNTIIIHGHTPIPHLIQRLNEVAFISNQFYDMPQKIEDVNIVKYCDGHKIDIDLGSFATGRSALLDLDTLEVKYFVTEVKGQ